MTFELRFAVHIRGRKSFHRQSQSQLSDTYRKGNPTVPSESVLDCAILTSEDEESLDV